MHSCHHDCAPQTQFQQAFTRFNKGTKKNLCYFDLVNLKKFSISFIILGLGKSQGLKPQTLSQAKSWENLLTCSSLPLSLSLSRNIYIFPHPLSIYIYILCVCVCSFYFSLFVISHNLFCHHAK